MRVTVLGSGTSHGVPMIGCKCDVCLSPDPRNKRFRPSIAVENDGHVILVDTGPELRLQALAFGLDKVDAVFYTHGHADHLFGLDDVRRFNDMSGEDMPIYADEATIEDIRRVYRYAFVETQAAGGKPRLVLNPVQPCFELFGMSIRSLTVFHGELPIQAYRFDAFAYVTDVNKIPAEAMSELSGLELLILDAVRFKPHATHFGLYEALEVIAELKPRRALLTHLSHAFDHAKVNAELPVGVELAFDGQRLEL